MPAAPSSSPPSTGTGTGTGITKLTNCRLVINDSLISSDLFISSQTGKIISPSDSSTRTPDITINLHNRIVSPGLIDCQLNGAFGFNFSSFTSSTEYIKNIHHLNTKLIRTGVTSYLPTLTSQRPELYHSVLPHLGPLHPSTSVTPNSNNDDHENKRDRNPQNGTESLGAHVEGPFLSPSQHGIHDRSVLRTATSFHDLESVYGPSNLSSGAIKMITLAPELSSGPNGTSITTLIPRLTSSGIIVSLGHTQTPLPLASLAFRSGAKMITHLFNAMRPLHHRDPGLFGLFGLPDQQKDGKLYYGVIADGIHLHPSVVAMAYNLHPEGFILVTDAMHLVGMEDGRYEWCNGERREWIEKRGGRVFIAVSPEEEEEGRASRRAGGGMLLEEAQGQQQNEGWGDVITGIVAGNDKVNGSAAEVDMTTNGTMNGHNGTVDGHSGHNGTTNADTTNGTTNADTNGQPNGNPNANNPTAEEKSEKKKWGNIAGSSSTLLQCLNNLLQWTDLSIPKALASVTSTPAEMLDLKGVKGSLVPGADADLVVFEEVDVEVDDMLGGEKVRRKQLVLEEVWKFGVRVFERDGLAG
ncbi:hypothetical protein B0T20DRAFT_459250 [Sordaria brevicollis]|uniref:Amidohydrolase 3 domain-containing protein n=1 Tax=Sordaria brevicollis TaxID=83679 RepID=A0AAE0UFU8_SORBR|nr:hypothetical protein B0T20DRAFT_459250 [Sordaria brevicollis]